ncbi:Crp/Fnr family transcriptional regulator [Xanthocytophaga agilis]|uniref:Crp/Fnr family transcriptional regulator n=1 Tax=Xanthocytophaga agilis TaxID=3048010 RepID=A0AAE3R8W7_9BACT|nr:Crp/Fnr family transcriptional regulator [Xanthocytophaga agilis]MDJ1505821.1 Crp/Fnr family transcriptional regulator [Xanthocytophaga agilis]
MFEIFYTYLTDKIRITEEEFELIRSKGIIKKLRKRQYLLQEGDVWRYYAFICKGCLRTYRVDAHDNEHILKFLIENWWAGDRESLLNGTPSRYNIDALEDSVLLLFPRQDFEALRDQIPAFDQLITNLIHRSYIASQERIHAAISYTSEEKYLNFIEKYPDIFNRVPLHMIASYLGVSPETLSRIRHLAVKK